MSKIFEVYLDKKEEEKKFADAEFEFLHKRNMEAEKNVVQNTKRMVEMQMKNKPGMARWYQNQIRQAIPNYDEYKKTTCNS